MPFSLALVQPQYRAQAKLFGTVDHPGNELTCKTEKEGKLVLFQ